MLCGGYIASIGRVSLDSKDIFSSKVSSKSVAAGISSVSSETEERLQSSSCQRPSLPSDWKHHPQPCSQQDSEPQGSNGWWGLPAHTQATVRRQLASLRMQSAKGADSQYHLPGSQHINTRMLQAAMQAASAVQLLAVKLPPSMSAHTHSLT